MVSDLRVLLVELMGLIIHTHTPRPESPTKGLKVPHAAETPGQEGKKFFSRNEHGGQSYPSRTVRIFLIIVQMNSAPEAVACWVQDGVSALSIYSPPPALPQMPVKEHSEPFRNIAASKAKAVLQPAPASTHQGFRKKSGFGPNILFTVERELGWGLA